MNIFEKLQSAISNVLSNKLRSFLTMLGIIIGVAAVITMVSVGQGMKTNITSQIQSLGSNRLTVRPGFQRVPPGMGIMQRGGMNIFTYDHYLGLRNSPVRGIKILGPKLRPTRLLPLGRKAPEPVLLELRQIIPTLKILNQLRGVFLTNMTWII